MDDCLECKQPLVEIDNRGQRLTGCMTCNIWWSAEGKKVRLSEKICMRYKPCATAGTDEVHQRQAAWGEVG